MYDLNEGIDDIYPGFKVEVLVSAIHALRAGEKKYPKPIFLLEETSIPRYILDPIFCFQPVVLPYIKCCTA